MSPESLRETNLEATVTRFEFSWRIGRESECLEKPSKVLQNASENPKILKSLQEFMSLQGPAWGAIPAGT